MDNEKCEQLDQFAIILQFSIVDLFQWNRYKYCCAILEN